MSVSRRVSIAWAPDYLPHEPTDTLVLTGRVFFVDQRVFRSSPASSGSRVDWAFAGQRTVEPPDEHGWYRSRWTHAVDSRSEAPDDDQGMLRSGHEGDDALTLEKGEMVNPATGRVTKHQEVWRDDAVASGTRVAFWERTGSPKAFVGLIGEWSLAVGREHEGEPAWTWRRRRAGVLFEEPPGSSHRGAGLLHLPPDAQEGATVEVDSQVWVLRESWTT